jgi:hypothetical protein
VIGIRDKTLEERAQAGDAGAYNAHGGLGGAPDGGVYVVPWDSISIDSE